ncbi:sodium- and chloride-dependent neutral and basic amino acid transporter B(0+)-like [Synchiropus picturatus]
MMIGKKSCYFWLFWRTCWFGITPCVVLVIFCWSLISYEPLTYGTVEYPEWGLALGWCILAFILLWIPLVAFIKLLREEGTLWKRLQSTCSPSEDWHPFLDIHRGDRYSADLGQREENTSQ